MQDAADRLAGRGHNRRRRVVRVQPGTRIEHGFDELLPREFVADRPEFRPGFLLHPGENVAVRTGGFFRFENRFPAFHITALDGSGLVSGEDFLVRFLREKQTIRRGDQNGQTDQERASGFHQSPSGENQAGIRPTGPARWKRSTVRRVNIDSPTLSRMETEPQSIRTKCFSLLPTMTRVTLTTPCRFVNRTTKRRNVSEITSRPGIAHRARLLPSCAAPVTSFQNTFPVKFRTK